MATRLIPRARMAVVAICIALMCVSAVDGVSRGLQFLASEPTRESPLNGVDLGLRRTETQAWFRGEPVYTQSESAIYPPATYVMLWPVLGLASAPQARVIWIILDAIALVALSAGVAAIAQPAGRLERVALWLLPASAFACFICLGLGQMTIAVTAACVAVCLWAGSRATPAGIAVWVGCALVALLKPSLSAPFLLVALLKAGWKERFAVVVTYLALTLFAAAYQSADPVLLLRLWLDNGSKVVASNDFGYSNLNWWLTQLGAARFNLVASLASLALFGVWLLARRDGSVIVAIGAAAVVSRLWTYHSSYDDLVIVVAMAALARVAARANGRRWRWAALFLLVANGLAGLTLLYPGWYGVFASFPNVLLVLWLATLGFLLVTRLRPETSVSGVGAAAVV